MAALEAPIATPEQQLVGQDEELVAKLRDGDQQAFQLLYDRYFKRVYHFLDRRLSNRADTEETVQEVFFNVFSSIDNFRGEAPFAAWVFGITRRTLASRFKRKRHPMIPLPDSDTESLDWAAVDTGNDPHEAYAYRERIARIDRAMQERLTEEQRKLVELHHLEHRSIEDIARVLCKSQDAVKSNLYRARKLLLAR